VYMIFGVSQWVWEDGACIIGKAMYSKDGGSANGFSIRSQKEWRTVFSAAVFFSK
jgi:hypothetical protein